MYRICSLIYVICKFYIILEILNLHVSHVMSICFFIFFFVEWHGQPVVSLLHIWIRSTGCTCTASTCIQWVLSSHAHHRKKKCMILRTLIFYCSASTCCKQSLYFI